MRSPLSYTIAMLLLACGPSGASEPRGPTAGSGGESTEAPPPGGTDNRVRAAAAPPTLSDEVVSADAADPSLVVSPESGWVVIPSFRLGVAMPDGWYWSNAEEMIRMTESTRHRLDGVNEEILRRGLQAVVNQYLPTDAAHAGELIPSFRVLLLPGGLPRGARLADDFCQSAVLPELVAVYPDATISTHSSLTVGGYVAARCGVDHSVTTVNGVILPAHSESVLVFGESHTIMIAAVGGANAGAADVLTAVMATVRPL